ncbi:hypothetical protein M405DRAFT_542550 [Rhizopogon salebrosus TDB-379]|nr:hypothetical protein M405DRAFT_542550 [Rhizopogon salebrosus TDB-379]
MLNNVPGLGSTACFPKPRFHTCLQPSYDQSHETTGSPATGCALLQARRRFGLRNTFNEPKKINIPDVISGNIIMLLDLFPSNTLLFTSVSLAYIHIHLTKSKCLGLDEGSWGAECDDTWL